MTNALNRREFLKHTSMFAAGAAVLSTSPFIRGAAAGEKVRVAVIGCNGRGMAHIAGYMALPNAQVVCICDVDSRALAKGVEAVEKKTGARPKGVKDLRQVLEDSGVDAISIATPEHWQAPATIMACAAGKHVYVEKPGSHNGRESQLMVAAARKHKRQVQMGNQRRSWPWVIQSIEAVKSGVIGEPRFARGWYANKRGPIGVGKKVPVPEWLDYQLWQGPAPERAYQDNILHYNWHWFWDWGTGELGNNGVHALDLARWGLGVDLPTRITHGGGRYFFKDDWEVPDTSNVTYDFGDKMITWDGQSCAPRGHETSGFGVTFFGDKGSVVIAGNDCKIYDTGNKEVRAISSKQEGLFGYDTVHFGNFIDGILSGKPLAAEIEEGQKSSLMCHLGNVAWRTGSTVNFDPKSGKILDNRAATALWSRTYRRGWEPKV